MELGQVTFTSSATISSVIPGATASEFIDEYNTLCGAETATHTLAPSGICVRIYAISSGDYVNLNANISAVIQTWQPELGTVLVTNNSTAPIHLVGLYVSGPDGVQSETELGTLVSGVETSASQTVLTDGPATWTTNQWAGYYLEYTTGPDAGQSLLIISNTGSTITTASFAQVPSANDKFQVNGGGIWVGGGEQVAMAIGDQLPTQLLQFVWATGQTYVVTVTTSTGIVLTGTFVSP